MANKRIVDLSENNTYDGDLYVEVDDGGVESEKMKLSVVLSEEEAAREDQDDVIEEGCGLETDGTYDPDDATNYIRTADFAAAAVTPSLKTADTLLDAKIKELEDEIDGMSALTSVAVTVPSPSPRALHSAPYNLIGAPTDDIGYYRQVVHATAKIDFGTAAVDVGANTLKLRYSNGTVIGTWTNAFYESAADACQDILMSSNVDIPSTGCIQLYCDSDDSVLTSTSDIVIYLVYRLIPV